MVAAICSLAVCTHHSLHNSCCHSSFFRPQSQTQRLFDSANRDEWTWTWGTRSRRRQVHSCPVPGHGEGMGESGLGA